MTWENEEIRVGGFVAYVRQRYRTGRLDPSRIADLERFAGWTWGSLRPGPRGHATRNEEIRRLRCEGWTLNELAAHFGMSRQRIYQIAPDAPDAEKHRARVQARRLEKRQLREQQRAMLIRREQQR